MSKLSQNSNNSQNLIDYKNLTSGKKLFNCIYVEEAAYEYPITHQVLQKYTNSTIIPIRNYKDVFNRTNQHFGIQKQYPSLILAVKNSPFLYRGPSICQNFGYSSFFYTSFLLNCLFDCEYCYLQGMYPSANLVAFVNIEDFKHAISKVVMGEKELVSLAASYDTDLIAFHSVIPYLDYFYEFFEGESDVLVEVRTKSANQAFYREHPPLKNLIIAFTLTPEDVIKKYERYTPSLEARIKAVKTAIENGFKVRICFDPIFMGHELDELYEEFYKYIFTQVDPAKIIDAGYGFFRMSRNFFKRIKRQKNNSLLFLDEYCTYGDIVSYPADLQEKIKAKHFKILTKYIKKERLFTL